MSDETTSAVESDEDAIIDNEDTLDEWTAPSREEYEALVERSRTANSEAAARKRMLRDNGISHKTGKKLDSELASDDDEESVPRKRVAEIEKSAAKRAKTLIKEVPLALSSAGIQPEKLRRAMDFLDIDSVSVDSDGEIDGLEEQIESLRNDFPEFFKRTRMQNVPDTKAVGSGKKAVESTREVSWEDQISAAYNKR